MAVIAKPMYNVTLKAREPGCIVKGFPRTAFTIAATVQATPIPAKRINN